MKKLLIALALLLGSTAQALPPYGFNMTQVDSSGDFFWGYYFIPSTPSASYIFMYDGTGIPSTNPLRMTAIGSGLSWDGTTLTSTVSSGQITTALGFTPGQGTVTSVTCGTGLSGGTITATGTCSVPAKSFNYTTRSLNTCFQASSSRDVLATYSVDIATSLSLTSGQQGTVYLEVFTNSSCSAGTQEIARFVNGQTGALTIGLALTQNVTGTLTGVIPAGSYIKLRTENNTGTPTFTARPGQETSL